jgi:outer membrane protein OmpA-like peptidoglycan-associated protein
VIVKNRIVNVVILFLLSFGVAYGKHYADSGIHVCFGVGLHAGPHRAGGHGRLWFNDLIGITAKGALGYDRGHGGFLGEALLKPRLKSPVKPYILVGGGYYVENMDTVIAGSPFRQILDIGVFTVGGGVEARVGKKEKHGLAIELAYLRGSEEYYHSSSPIGEEAITMEEEVLELSPFSAKFLYTFYFCQPVNEDRDGDGYVDELDNCPDDPEDFDKFHDDDGCPEYDNDVDGLADTVDNCPLDPEDVDGFEDEDGCPELDNDQDGILDSVDNCPLDAEDFDGFEDEDGCPELDNDQDGILDAVDNCPLEPETVNDFYDEDGCPDVRPVAIELSREAMVLDGVTFKSGKAILKESSYSTLDDVVESLLAWFEVNLEIQGHTDAVGAELSNRILSHNRAKAVKEYFISQGIAPERLRAVGYGETMPVADNATTTGRQENRRVELHRID